MEPLDQTAFAGDLKLDPEQLDVEAVRQSEIFFLWAERSVEAKSDADRLKLVLDVVEARLAGAVRRNPEAFGIEGRPTESAQSAAVKQNPEFLEAHDKWLDAREVSSMLDKAVAALEMKKRMIEVLITLHGQQYFAGPGTPRNLVAAWHEHQEKTGISANARQRAKVRKRGNL